MINSSILTQDIQENPEITIGQLAEKHGTSYPVMSFALRKSGIRAKRKKTTKHRAREGSRAFKVLAFLINNPDINFSAIAEQFSCTREYVSQIEAMARQEGIIK